MVEQKLTTVTTRSDGMNRPAKDGLFVMEKRRESQDVLKKSPGPEGFTLIEVIVMMVVFAVFATMIAAYFGSGILRSHEPIQRLQKATDLQTIMDGWIDAYDTDTYANLAALKTAVDATPHHQSRYVKVEDFQFVDDTSGNPFYLLVTITPPTGEAGMAISYLFAEIEDENDE